MASRSFKPASYLASQPTRRSPRPSFTRSSSASSVKSTKSEDSFIATLKGLTTTENAPGVDADQSTGSLGSAGGASPRCPTPVNSSSSTNHSIIDDTPGRKRSQPIAIELPSRTQPVYTPLSARGDLPGGYFPNHETLPKPYNSHPFSRYHQENKDRREQKSASSEPPSPLMMSSNTSSAVASSTDTTPRAPPCIISPAIEASFPVPEVLTIPKGKYHPANYKAPAKPAPTSAPSLPPTNLSLPPSVPERKKKSRPGHERQGSDVKRKLQEYQLGQMKQAQMLAQAHGGSGPGGSKPISPRLLPLGSPGPITPFELEDSADSGYVVAGARAATNGLIGRGLERERDRELVGRMIRAEEDRRVLGGKEGSQSPVLRV